MSSEGSPKGVGLDHFLTSKSFLHHESGTSLILYSLRDSANATEAGSQSHCSYGHWHTSLYKIKVPWMERKGEQRS